MFSSKLKRSIATVAAITCVLGAAGPASASSAQRLIESQDVPTSMEVVGMAPNGGLGHARGFKSLGGMDSETEFMDYTDDALVASVSATGLKYETEITDYLQRHTAPRDLLAVHAGGGWDPLGYQNNQNDLDAGQAPSSDGFWLGSNDALG